MPGKGSITIAWPEPATIDRVVWGRDREEVYRDRLATEYYLEAALEPGRWQVVASSLDRVRYDPSAVGGQVRRPRPPVSRPTAVRERAELTARQAELRARLSQLGPTIKVYAGTFSQPGPTHLLVRGDPTRKGPEVRAGDGRRDPSHARARSQSARVAAPRRSGAVDRRSGQSAAGAGDGQPGLALPFRPGDRGDAQRLWL